jgi:hypothetical protein
VWEDTNRAYKILQYIREYSPVRVFDFNVKSVKQRCLILNYLRNMSFLNHQPSIIRQYSSLSLTFWIYSLWFHLIVLPFATFRLFSPFNFLRLLSFLQFFNSSNSLPFSEHVFLLLYTMKFFSKFYFLRLVTLFNLLSFRSDFHWVNIPILFES